MKTAGALLVGSLLAQALGAEPSDSHPFPLRMQSLAALDSSPAHEVELIRRARALQEAISARAHERTGAHRSSSGNQGTCPWRGTIAARPELPQVYGTGVGAVTYQPPSSSPRSSAGRPGGSAPEIFGKAVSEQVVQSRCIRCHVAGGASGQTRLVFVPRTAPDHQSKNF